MAASKKSNLKNAPVSHSVEELKKYYKDMLLMRRFEEKAGQLYGMGLIGGFCHLYNGQEAVVTGIQSVQEPQDTVVTTYREHAHALIAGMEPKEIMAELTGRSGGCSAGKGGSMHIFSAENNFYGGHGIVGASSAIGTGLAFAHKYKEDKGVCVAYMGDGAANQGQVAECYNMAALWKLPVLYVIENNKYAMGTSCQRHCAGELYKRGEGYGIKGEQVDGMDLFAIKAAAKKALDYIRSGNGPYILEVMTYRYRGHSMSDPGKYRTKEEVASYKDERDPISNLKEKLINEKLATEDELKAIANEIKDIIKEAVDFATNCPEPEPSELWTDVLVPVEE